MRNLLILLTLFAALLLVIACSDSETVAARIQVINNDIDNFSIYRSTTYTTANNSWAVEIFNCAGWTEDTATGEYHGRARFDNVTYYSMQILENDNNSTLIWEARVEVLDNDSSDIISYSRQRELIAQRICERLKEPDNVTNGWESLTLED